MNADKIVNTFATVTLVEMMVTIGLGVKLADVVGVARDLRLVARAAAANYLVVPAAAVLLLLWFRTPPMAAVGLLVAAVCAGAPYGPPFTSMAKGNVIVSVGLMVILAGTSAIVAPVLLRLLVPVVAGNQPVDVDAGTMVGALVLSQLLPLCIGLSLRHRKPKLADRIERPLSRLSVALNLLLLGFVLAVQFRMLAKIRLTGYAGMLALVASSVIAGWVFGGRHADIRKSMVFATSVRNVGVSLVIASASFPDTPAVAAATAYAVFQTVVTAAVAAVWGTSTSSTNARSTKAA